jgi:YHS domain-containing protein
MKTLARSILLGGALAVAPLSSALAVDELNVSVGYSVVGKPLAMHGYDPVAYFTVGRPTQGSDSLVYVHDGAAYRFVSQQNLDAFKANPARYVPAYGGFCAYGVALGKKFDGDPDLWKIVDGKLYLNLNEEIQSKWSQDIAGNIRKANSQWQSIASRPANTL